MIGPLTSSNRRPYRSAAMPIGTLRMRRASPNVVSVRPMAPAPTPNFSLSNGNTGEITPCPVMTRTVEKLTSNSCSCSRIGASFRRSQPIIEVP